MKKKTESKERFIPHVSLLFATCCTSLSIEDATNKMNQVSPTGTKSRWQLAGKDSLPEMWGDCNPCPCSDNPEWKHLFYIC